MRYYIKYESGEIQGYMEYPYENQTMTEVTKEEYYQIRKDNGIIDIVDETPTEVDRIADLETMLADMIGGAL